MRNLIASEFMSLDGVVQSPMYPDEDPSGGFAHGGWHRPYLENASMTWTVDNVKGAGGYLLGRGTYERFAAHWPSASPEEQALAEPMNRLPKFVASRTLAGPLAWHNARLLRGDVAEAVRELKREHGPDLVLIGSPLLLRTLLEHDLVDELRLMIDPLVLGAGKRFFPVQGLPRSLRLIDAQPTSTGALLVTYAGRV